MEGPLRRKIYWVCEWITRLAYVNVLWLLFTICGGLVFGIFPATAAMFGTYRQRMVTGDDVPVFRTFWTIYRSEFFKTNMLGYLLLFIGIVLYVDFKLSSYFHGAIFDILDFGILGLVLLYIVTILYLFPVFVHFKLNIFQNIKQSLFMGITHPLRTAAMVAGTLTICYVNVSFQGLIPFFSGSVISLLLMWFAYQSFPKPTKRQEI